MGDPFDLSDALIRDTHHVRVTRNAPRNGRPCEYVKVFKPTGLGNAAYWIRREYDFLLDFSLKKLKQVVEFATITQGGDGIHTPIVESVATRDAGVTLCDWLCERPRYADGDTLRHPFRHAGMFLELLRACLVALHEIHRANIVHCDIKEDNICLPYAPYPLPPGQTVRIDFKRLRLIDFAFSITTERPLEWPLPIGVLSAEQCYQSKLLKTALQKDISHTPGGIIHAQRLDYRVDLYSLGYMAGRILQAGLLQPLGTAGHAAVIGAQTLVERLKAYDDGQAQADNLLPHAHLIADIDALLEPLEDLEAYREFIRDGQQKAPPYNFAPTPMASPTRQGGSEEPLRNGESSPPIEDTKQNVKPSKTKRPKLHNQYIHRLVLAAELLGGLGGLLLAVNLAMRYGYLDWTGACRLLGEDRQIRECRLWPGSDTVIRRSSVNFPFRLPPLPVLPGDNSTISPDGSLTIGLAAKQYKRGDSLQVQAAVAIPLYLRIFNIDDFGKIDPFNLGKSADKPIEPGSIAKYPPNNPVYSIENKIDTAGTMTLVAIASEKPIPKDAVLLDNHGKLTAQAEALSPTVARLGYVVKDK